MTRRDWSGVTSPDYGLYGTRKGQGHGVDAEGARVHIRRLRNAGMTVDEIADAVGHHSSHGWIASLGSGSRERVSVELQERIFAIPVPPTPEPSDESWKPRARCRDVDPGFFYPDAGNVAWQRAIVAMCEPCPVRDACLGWAVETKQEDGWYGGVSIRQHRFPDRRKKQEAA